MSGPLSLPLLAGTDSTPGIVAVEYEPGKDGPDVLQVFIRDGKKLLVESPEFRPFLWLSEAALLKDFSGKAEFFPLSGNNPLKCIATFGSWKDCQDAAAHLRKVTDVRQSDGYAPYLFLTDPVQQYLLASGRTLFKGMGFNDLHRMQVDIETYSAAGYDFSNAERESDRVIAIALSDNRGWSEVLSGAAMDEKKLLETFVARVKERDPDVIEGHNIFRFDFAYLNTRAKRHKLKLKLGRDGSPPYVRASRLSVAEQVVAYPRVEIHGRHVVDTLFLVMAYDVSHRALESFTLKDVAVHFGLAAKNRTYIDGAEIARVFETDPDRLMAYAGDDAKETRALANMLLPSYFTQAQMLPYGFQNICVRGNGTKIDSLLLRDYWHAKASVPLPDEAREFAGGYTDIFFTGVATNVHHCDVRSLYPSIMLKDRIGPRTDERGVFLQLLERLRDFRVEAKQAMQKAKDDDTRTYFDALQTTFKILINSFYGYLGFGQGRFNDFAAATKIAATGRTILQQMINVLRERGANPIEIDTDGIYFIPPDVSGANLEKFRADVQAALPPGIDIEFDGEYRTMFSYKMKNYALLDHQGVVTIKGAALKSRGLEPFQRDYLRKWIRHTLEVKPDAIEKLKTEFREAIQQRTWPIRMLAKTETLQDSPATYAAKIGGKSRGRNAAYELALKSTRDYRAGDQITYYVTGTKKSVAVYESAKLVAEWNPEKRDENVPFYLAKLDGLIDRFDRILTEDKSEQGELSLEDT